MSNFYSADGFASSSFKGSTLIVPAVSLGNVPQLTSDLLISSLGLKRVGWIGTGDTVAPFVGAGDDGALLTGGLEVYGQIGSELYVVQQRSPTLKSKKDEHVALLRDFIAIGDFSFVLLLTSLDAASQDDAQLSTPHQRILPPQQSSQQSAMNRLSELLPPLTLNVSEEPIASTSKIYPPFLPAAGLTRRLLSSLSDTAVPHGAVTAWCVEGDNRIDARALAVTTLRVLGIEIDVQIQEPKSWEGLFGSAEGWSGGSGADAELYG